MCFILDLCLHLSAWVKQKDEGRRMKDEEPLPIHPSSFRTHPSKVAWLSLDEGDNDPIRFLTYVVAALQTLALSGVEGLAPIGAGLLAAGVSQHVRLLGQGYPRRRRH
jgi:hypothetical protein